MEYIIAEVGEIAPKIKKDDRVCCMPLCTTKLSHYNPNHVCFAHLDEFRNRLFDSKATHSSNYRKRYYNDHKR